MTGSNDGTARRWHFMDAADSSSHALQLQQKPTSISHKAIDSSKKAVTALAWHPDGTVFATGRRANAGRADSQRLMASGGFSPPPDSCKAF